MRTQAKSFIMDFLTGMVLVFLTFAIPLVISLISMKAAVNATVFVLFKTLVPTTLFLGGGIYRGRRSASNPWVVLLLLNLAYAGVQVLQSQGTPGSAASFSIMLHPIVFSGLGIYLGRHWQGKTTARRIVLTTAPLLAVNIVLFFFAPPLVRNETNLAVEVNEPAPGFEFSLPGGAKLTSESLQGKVVVLDFWGTWCVPCIEEFPQLEQLYEKYKHNENILFFAVNANLGGDTREKARQFFDKNRYKLPWAYDDSSKTYKALQVAGMPGIIILDKSGNVRIRHIGYMPLEDLAANLSKHIAQLLKEN